MKAMFYLYHNKFQQLSDKAIDCFIESWELTGIERQAALFKRKKYVEKSMLYLDKANKLLK